MEVTRTSEQAKYEACYALPTYHLQGARLRRVTQDIDSMEPGKSYLDVGCGRGEMIKRAITRGVDASGVELVPALCVGSIVNGIVTDIPFGDDSFDYVSCFDVLEHLPEDQTDRALDELFRVCRETLLLTTNAKPSHLGDLTLHLTRKPRAWWDAKIVERAGSALIIRSEYGVDEWHWRIDL